MTERAAEVKTNGRTGKGWNQTNQLEKKVVCGGGWRTLTVENPYLVRLSFISYLLNKYLFVDFLDPGALRSSDKETKAQGGKTTYCRSYGETLHW